MKTLDSLAVQDLPDEVKLRVIVADNDTTDAARAPIEAYARYLELNLHYVHAPERNISIARNACLDAATSDWLAFIDDDEIAMSDWIASLMAQRGSNHVIFGVSQALYPDPKTPKWIADGDFHSNRIAGNDGAWNGYTANVMIDRRFIEEKNLRFAVEMGQIGGEDTVFFFQAHRAGARFGYAPGAIVQEETPLVRANLRWLALRRYRAGQVHFMIVKREGRGTHVALAAVAKAMAAALIACALVPWRTRAIANALRAMLHVGVLASAVGVAPYREYSSPSGDK